MADEDTTGPIFRSNKRRKIFRKHADTDSEDGMRPIAPTATENGGAAITNPPLEDQEDAAGGVMRAQRRGGVKRWGIGFSSAPNGRNEYEQNQETALVLVPNEEERQEAMMQNQRFVKPTGRVVEEDKHMTAYIDSKMAEMRSSAMTVNLQPPNGAHEASHIVRPTGYQDDLLHEPIAGPKAGERTTQAAQSRSTRTYQRPTRRRPSPGRDEADKARDSIIDQIMNESQVPHYDRATVDTAQGDDNDAAVAEAFKANLLADLEKQRRRPALKNAGAATGPKLGGSRAQRERMRATEEAKKGGGDKK